MQSWTINSSKGKADWLVKSWLQRCGCRLHAVCYCFSPTLVIPPLNACANSFWAETCAEVSRLCLGSLRCSSLSTKAPPQNIRESDSGSILRFLPVSCRHFSSSCACRTLWTRGSLGPETWTLKLNIRTVICKKINIRTLKLNVFKIFCSASYQFYPMFLLTIVHIWCRSGSCISAARNITDTEYITNSLTSLIRFSRHRCIKRRNTYGRQ